MTLPAVHTAPGQQGSPLPPQVPASDAQTPAPQTPAPWAQALPAAMQRPLGPLSSQHPPFRQAPPAQQASPANPQVGNTSLRLSTRASFAPGGASAGASTVPAPSLLLSFFAPSPTAASVVGGEPSPLVSGAGAGLSTLPSPTPGPPPSEAKPSGLAVPLSRLPMMGPVPVSPEPSSLLVPVSLPLSTVGGFEAPSLHAEMAQAMVAARASRRVQVIGFSRVGFMCSSCGVQAADIASGQRSTLRTRGSRFPIGDAPGDPSQKMSFHRRAIKNQPWTALRTRSQAPGRRCSRTCSAQRRRRSSRLSQVWGGKSGKLR